MDERIMSNLNAESVYKEICQNIRETDAISFKLLNIVPLGSTLGGGILSLFQKSTLLENAPSLVIPSSIVFLSLTGSVLVFGLYKWELRNIQKCKFLIDQAANIEGRGTIVQYKGWNQQKAIWGKTRAERLIYRTSILIWLIPVAILCITYLQSKLG
jgi:hypothetical protein